GVNHSDQGTETVNAINNLSLLTGKIGKPGSAPFSITGQCNAMGTREASCTSALPGYRKFESESDRREIAALWGIERGELPTARGLAYPDIIEGIVKDRIKALWVIATNPLVSYPNRDFLEDALSRLDFLVVQDGFHPTPTTALADLVLPAAIWGEKEGTYTNSERRVSKVNKAVDPPGEALTDFDIFLSIARKLGAYDRLYPGWTGPEDAYNEWRRVSKGRLCDYSGISYELLEKAGAVQWPFPETVKGDVIAAARATRRLYADGVFPHEDNRAKFFAIEQKSMPESPDAEYPLLLNTGRTVEHWHTRTKTGKIAILETLSPQSWVEMNPRDARKLKLRQGDHVRVTSRRGEIERIALRITDIVAPGQIFIPFHWFETNANNLTLNICDPISREPNFKQCAVRVENPA
ncbi:MAG: molybdopterin-dependent oxidoreductase, partial [Candidatus Hydrogenedentota bacterium]